VSAEQSTDVSFPDYPKQSAYYRVFLFAPTKLLIAAFPDKHETSYWLQDCRLTSPKRLNATFAGLRRYSYRLQCCSRGPNKLLVSVFPVSSIANTYLYCRDI
jgi:hypothetical protein